ncbi:MAG TPA: hypothetical protein VE912_07850 [Bacteroidales bacterium]|nr:hypothetical protein [Bacteroidales bacterium]
MNGQYIRLNKKYVFTSKPLSNFCCRLSPCHQPSPFFQIIDQLRIVHGAGRQPNPDALAVPPFTLRVAGPGKPVAVQHSTHISWGLVRERVGGKQLQCLPIIVQQLPHQVPYKRVMVRRGHGGKPYLYIICCLNSRAW